MVHAQARIKARRTADLQMLIIESFIEIRWVFTCLPRHAVG